MWKSCLYTFALQILHDTKLRFFDVFTYYATLSEGYLLTYLTCPYLLCISLICKQSLLANLAFGLAFPCHAYLDPMPYKSLICKAWEARMAWVTNLLRSKYHPCLTNLWYAKQVTQRITNLRYAKQVWHGYALPMPYKSSICNPCLTNQRFVRQGIYVSHYLQSISSICMAWQGLHIKDLLGQQVGVAILRKQEHRYVLLLHA